MEGGHRDPLGDVLTLLRPETVLAAELRAYGSWGLSFESYPHVKFGTIAYGRCVIAVRGGRAQRFERGDVYLLCNPPPYVMASDVRASRQQANAVFSRATDGVVQLGRRHGNLSAHLIGGHFVLDAANAHLLVDALPSLVRIPADAAGSVRDIARLLIDEVRASQLGRVRALDQLAQLLLTFTLRSLERASKGSPTGWLRAIADPQIGPALRHIHTNVGGRTSLVELARVAGMSRTTFAERFKDLVGMPPLGYAIQWKMSLAKDALRTGDRPVGELAFAFGYESESAFSTAFRREVGCSPRAYRIRTAKR
jgi:AraC-like DNA-binding protein